LTDLDSDDDDGGLGDGGFGEDDREPDTVSGEPGTYTVKKTDTTGFWGIAEDYYGHGKYYTLIRDANPNVSSTALRPGTKLTMPPKPKRTSSASKKYGKLLKTAQHGKVVETVTGKKYYIVKKGDNGFWGVSEAAYGSGKHYQKIMAANPDVDTAGLQPGMKLVIPDLDKTSSAGSSGRARSKDHGKIIEGATGQKYYVVKKGDRGFVSVAEAAWGNGNLWPAVRDANPTLNPRALQPGMKIKVPKKPKASELPLVRGTAPSEPVETDDDGDDARPDFSGRLD
jgi:nucleoid-associated protein YgaU